MLTNRLLQHHMLKRPSFKSIIRIYSKRYAFSALSEKAQQAFIAQNTLNIIESFNRQKYLTDTRSIRELILDRTYFKKQMINLIQPIEEKGQKIHENKESWINSQFQEKNYLAVLEAFQLYCGAPYDKLIWPQDRMSDQNFRGRIILFPVSSTQNYFSKLSAAQNGILSGTKGTGKSFSLFTYSYLASFKVKYFSNSKENQQNELLLYGKPSYWSTVTQICYINLQAQRKYQKYFQQISRQFLYLYPQEEIEKDYLQHLQQEKKIQQNLKKKEREKNKLQGIVVEQEKEMIKQEIKTETQPNGQVLTQVLTDQDYKKKLIFLIKRLNLRAKNHSIKIMCVIDEANRIFKRIRQLETFLNKNGQSSKWKQTQQLKDLKFYQSLFKYFFDKTQHSFYGLFFNSSQDFQWKNIIDDNNKIFKLLKKQLPFIQSFKNQRIFGQPVGSGYSQLMTTNEGKIQLYNIYWFEILKQIRKRSVLGQSDDIYLQFEKKTRIHREIFQDQFRISKDSNTPIYQNWKNEVQHLSIRSYLNSIINFGQYSVFSLNDNIFLSQNPTEKQITNFRKDIRILKQNIENYRKDQIVQSITSYIRKSTSIAECNKRKSYLNTILTQAEENCSNKAVQGISNISYGYLSKLQLPNLEQKALVQSIQIGFFEKQILKFNMSPGDLLQLMSFTLRDRTFNIQVARIVKNLFIDHEKKGVNALVGKYLDKVSFPFFVDGHFDLKYIEYQMEGGGNLSFDEPKEQYKQFSVGQTCPIKGISKRDEDTNLVFKRIVKLADENFDKSSYVGGFPAKLIQNQIQNNNKKKGQSVNNNDSKRVSFAPFENHMLFDNMILKKLKSAQKGKKVLYEMILYDWTMGKPRSKWQKDFKTLTTKYLSQSNIKGNIKCKLLIVAPDFFLQEHFNWWRSYRNQSKKQDKDKKHKKNSLKSHLPDIYGSFGFKNKIQGVFYQRNVTVGLASFDEKSPFQLITQSPNSVLIDYVTECYKQIQEIEDESQKK